VVHPAQAQEAKKPRALALQKPDGIKNTHEYELGRRSQARTRQVPTLDTVLVNADIREGWARDARKADGVVLFISEGAKWLSADPKRSQAFQEAAKRKWL